MKNSYSEELVVKKIIDFCLEKYKFIFISGNGGAGKTTLSKSLANEMNSRGAEVNCIDMDEFVVDTKMRKSAKKEWVDIKNNKRVSDYTTSFRESYYLAAPEAIIHSLINRQNCFYRPKKIPEFIEIKGKLPLTIIEGVGTAFLEKNEMAYGIFLTCEREIEVSRRIDRARNGEINLSREEIEKKCIERNEQFEATVLPEKYKFDLELQSLADYSLRVERDNLNIF